MVNNKITNGDVLDTFTWFNMGSMSYLTTIYTLLCAVLNIEALSGRLVDHSGLIKASLQLELQRAGRYIKCVS